MFRLFRKTLATHSIILCCLNLSAQSVPDTLKLLNDVVVRSYFSNQPLLKSTASVGVLTSKQLQNQSEQSLIPAINSLPGVRMEERSPGSYRLSIRGSLLRSPFGIRNIKLYIDEYALTDAGGNSYLNLLDAGTLNSITVLKGPHGSSFGANTGGVVLIDPLKLRDSSFLSASLTAGSYGLFHQRASIQKQWKNYSFNFNQGYQNADGYRENSALERKYASLSQKWQYTKKSQLRSTFLFSDLNYQTPGGLTAQQAELNPRLARPATNTLPGAIQQQAGIKNKTLFGGVLNEYQINSSIRHIISIFGSATDFKNPFITNYEERSEKSAGIRTFLEHQLKQNKFHLISNMGIESQATGSDINNSKNNSGTRGLLQSQDELKAFQTFYFAHLSANFFNNLTIEAGTSINRYSYSYKTVVPVTTPEAKKRFDQQLMPRLAVSYLFNTHAAWRASVSRGYSPPTIAEVRASNNVINTNLQPESGWNYETGLRISGFSDRVFIDLNIFYFHLQDAIVRRVNANDTEFFINAGGTKQRGFEGQLVQWLVSPNSNRFIRSLQLRTGITLNHFKFHEYVVGNAVFSGNKLTGVPRDVFINSLDVEFVKGFSFFAQHNYTSSIPLNDANSAYADSYHLIQLKTFWRPYQKNKRFALQLFAGADNLLNTSYSLGNDLNAVGNRFYNPAADLNSYVGLTINFK
ncbi:MAG TPA: TonB-dependent receptor [Sphingobacteriaceae bacterium]|nr:TonB-dependent receptor [Sphingobacteriaceae bacterium]